MLTKNDEEKIQDIVVQVIQEALIPAFDDLATKADLKKVENKLDRVENRLEQMDRKLDVVTAKVYTHDSQLADYGKKIKKLERVVAS